MLSYRWQYHIFSSHKLYDLFTLLYYFTQCDISVSDYVLHILAISLHKYVDIIVVDILVLSRTSVSILLLLIIITKLI